MVGQRLTRTLETQVSLGFADADGNYDCQVIKPFTSQD